MLGIGNKTGVESGTINLIGNGTQINGDIDSVGDVRIDGTLTGNISLKGLISVSGPTNNSI